MTVIDQIKRVVAELASKYGHDSKVAYQSVETCVEDHLSRVHAFNTPLITCKDCKHYELEGMYKGCCLLHLERMTGYDPLSDSSYDNDIGMYEMPSDGFCSSAEWRDA